MSTSFLNNDRRRPFSLFSQKIRLAHQLAIGRGSEQAHIGMGRFGKTEELEGGLLFLVNNDAAGFITGVVLPIDGGFSSYSGV